MSILFGNHWMYSTMICVETKRTLFRTQVATHCMFIIMTVIITVSRRFLLLFCFFFSIRVVYACDFQFALFTLVDFLFVHTYRKAFTNINNNNTFELIFVLSRLRFRFVSIPFFFNNSFEIVKWIWVLFSITFALDCKTKMKHKSHSQKLFLSGFHLRQQFTSNGFSFHESQNVGFALLKNYHTPPNIRKNTIHTGCVHVYVCRLACMDVCVYVVCRASHIT